MSCCNGGVGLPLTVVSSCVQTCAIPLNVKQPYDRSSSDNTDFLAGKALYGNEQGVYGRYTYVSSIIPAVYTIQPGVSPFPTFRTNADYIRYKKMNVLLTKNYTADTYGMQYS
jgi:hypothetical protein